MSIQPPGFSALIIVPVVLLPAPHDRQSSTFYHDLEGFSGRATALSLTSSSLSSSLPAASTARSSISFRAAM